MKKVIISWTSQRESGNWIGVKYPLKGYYAKAVIEVDDEMFETLAALNKGEEIEVPEEALN